jgi:hypothetical protein
LVPRERERERERKRERVDGWKGEKIEEMREQSARD